MKLIDKLALVTSGLAVVGMAISLPVKAQDISEEVPGAAEAVETEAPGNDPSDLVEATETVEEATSPAETAAPAMVEEESEMIDSDVPAGAAVDVPGEAPAVTVETAAPEMPGSPEMPEAVVEDGEQPSEVDPSESPEVETPDLPETSEAVEAVQDGGMPEDAAPADMDR